MAACFALDKTLLPFEEHQPGAHVVRLDHLAGGNSLKHARGRHLVPLLVGIYEGVRVVELAIDRGESGVHQPLKDGVSRAGTTKLIHADGTAHTISWSEE